jgi:hypothetical protein
MANICYEPPSRAEHVRLDADFTGKTFNRIDQTIAMGALFTAHHLGAKAIVALTDSGSTALWMSRHRIHVPIYALTPKRGHAAQDGAVPQCAPAADGHRAPSATPRWTRPKATSRSAASWPLATCMPLPAANPWAPRVAPTCCASPRSPEAGRQARPGLIRRKIRRGVGR